MLKNRCDRTNLRKYWQCLWVWKMWNVIFRSGFWTRSRKMKSSPGTTREKARACSRKKGRTGVKRIGQFLTLIPSSYDLGKWPLKTTNPLSCPVYKPTARPPPALWSVFYQIGALKSRLPGFKSCHCYLRVTLSWVISCSVPQCPHFRTQGWCAN